ncbi:MAG TPA: AAA family ATPase, partial [Pyrinomonadaceae bacterium]
MSSLTQTTQNEAKTGIRQPRRASEVLAAKFRPAEPLFNAFWQTGELALMFGEPGVGKSVLAVQIADALARGKPLAMHDAECTMHNSKAKRQKVLYVDLVLSDAQFALRYGRYKFSANLYRDAPAEGEDLVA